MLGGAVRDKPAGDQRRPERHGWPLVVSAPAQRPGADPDGADPEAKLAGWPNASGAAPAWVGHAGERTERANTWGVLIQRDNARILKGSLPSAKETCQVDLRFAVIPRPETEDFVNALTPPAGAGCTFGAALDVGTGSRAIALGLADEGRARTVVVTDVSPKVQTAAWRNARPAGRTRGRLSVGPPAGARRRGDVRPAEHDASGRARGGPAGADRRSGCRGGSGSTALRRVGPDRRRRPDALADRARQVAEGRSVRGRETP